MPDEKPPQPPTPPPAPAPAEMAPDGPAKKLLYEPTDDRKFQWYMERRKGYSSGARESYQRYDQTIATVSAGAIVFSITFLKDIGHTPESMPWLFASWVAFLVAGGAGLVSLRTSADCDIEHLTALEALKKGDPYAKFEEKAQKLGKTTVTLNKVSLWSFLMAIFLMMLFAFVNVSKLGGTDCPPVENADPAKAARQVPRLDGSPLSNAPHAPIRRVQPPPSTSPKATPANPSPHHPGGEANLGKSEEN